MTVRTRFAPSPTGPLHIGHAYAALVAQDLALASNGTCLLRIEDIDQSRARAHWEAQIYDDLGWLGFTWQTPVMRQSERMERYHHALDHLWAEGLLYPCTCNRRDIQAALSAPQEGAPIHGPDGLVYPGTCRSKLSRTGNRPHDVSLRLDMAMALDRLGHEVISYVETGTCAPVLKCDHPRNEILTGVGDVVLARKDMGTSYHLSVVLDDHDQGITMVTRGADLAPATVIHVILQKLLELRPCTYHHHRLIRDEAGKRLAKRDDARAIAAYRTDGLSPADIRQMIGFTPSAP